MIHQVLKRTLTAAAVSSCLVAGQANAFLMCTDFPALAEDMYGNMQDAMNWAQEQAMNTMNMDMEAMFQQLTADQNDNLAAFDAFNSGMRDQEIQNKEIEKEMAGNFQEACNANALSKSFELSFCSTIAEQNDMIDKEANKSLDTATNRKDFKKKQEEVVDELEEMCLGTNDFKGKPGWNKVSASIAQATCHRGDYITGASGGGALTEDQVEDAKNAIKLIANNIPKEMQDYNRDPNSDFNKQQRLAGFRKMAMKNLATRSLTEVMRWHTSGDGVGALASWHAFNDSKYNDPNGCWVAKWSGTPKASCSKGDFKEDNKLSPQVLREQLLIQGFMCNIAVYQFEHLLRMEALTAALLAVEVEPI